MKSPVLVMVFARPDTTRAVMEAIRAARPPRLYVAADGARATKPGEGERCAETRAIVSAVDWPCEVKTLLRDSNLGCKRAVSSAIDWFFENEPEGIVLEDDTVPLPSFFDYADALLQHYRGDERVMMVNGCNLISHRYRAPHSYFLSGHAHVWGWASWRRAWRHYDVTISDWPEVRRGGQLESTAIGSRLQWRWVWHPVYDALHDGLIDTWDYQWTYAILKQAGLTATPRTSLVRNIGFGAAAGGAHTAIEPPEYVRNAILSDITLPLDHPPIVERDREADALEETYLFGQSVRGATIRWLARQPFGRDALAAAQKAKHALSDIAGRDR
jgi:hypothetical protein